MRALLILAVLVPLAILVSYVLAQAELRRRKRGRHIEELEAENLRLDELLEREREKQRRAT